MDTFSGLANQVRPRLRVLYGSQAEECLSGILQVCRCCEVRRVSSPESRWNERDVVLIAYADQIRAADEVPLATLRTFLHESDLQNVTRVLHLLPFFPASSDDGFSVIDYRQVDPEFGNWGDIAALRQEFDLMFDLVLNHASSQSAWFQKCLQRIEPWTKFFAEAEPTDDLSRVVRPRTSPLLTRFETAHGTQHFWTTFSADQVDLDYRNPRVLLEMLDILLFYVRQGARILRFDAVAYLWKQPGTTCIHLPQTHTIVKLLRKIIDSVAPGTLLLTETNVPHAENISYWGDSDEAHLIYNFSLPPLLLDALLTGDATYINRWLAELSPPPHGTSFLNFTASHDGIGIRPLESLVPAERFAGFVKSVQNRGGLVSQRADSNGQELPYELNITWFDALSDPASTGSEEHVQRFLASQTLMLSLRGIPAVYFHNLIGTPNDLAGVRRTGRARSINRRKFDLQELRAMLAPDTTSRRIFDAYRRLLAIRIEQPAFHPDATQEVFDCADSSLIVFLRSSIKCNHKILVVANVSGQMREIDLSSHSMTATGDDLIAGKLCYQQTSGLMLTPFQVAWLPVATSLNRESSG